MGNLSRNGLIGTVIFHLLVAFLLIFFGFSYPDPPPEEQGILVNFGTDDSGSGYVEPAGDPEQGGESTEAEEVSEDPVEEVREETSVPVTPVEQQEVAEEIQDYEESPVKENKPTPEELRQKEIERQKAIDAEIKRQQELERIRLEEERKKQAEKLQQMGESAFGNKGTGTTTGSEGITEGTGNQGSLSGQPGVENYGDGSGLGNGISHGFGNRGPVGDLATPDVEDCQFTTRIIVKVQIDLDSQGNVVGNPKVLDATFQDDCIYNAVLRVARTAKFEISDDYRQRGWIRYIIDP